MFEFWLGMLELGVQFPTMFKGWGPNLDNCLAGLEESFGSSQIRAVMQTPSTQRGIDRDELKPLRSAKIFDLLQQNQITRMPNIPKANYDDLPETVEISSDEEEEDDDDEEPD